METMLARAHCRWLVPAIIASCVNVAVAQSATPTTITVSLPADARLTVNGRQTSSTGELREFRDSQASPGIAYHYVLRATVDRDGRSVSQVRSLRLPAGATQHVRYEFPQKAAARKQLAASSDEQVVYESAFQSRFQPRPGPASDLPELPAQDEATGDGFQPRVPDLSDPTGGASPPAAQLQPPALDDAGDTRRFGRQFGEEPTGDDLLPPDDVGAPLRPFDSTRPVDPMKVEKSPGETRSAMPGNDSATTMPPLAYIGHGHQHHLTSATGTALHVWRHRYRLVRLEKSSATAGPYAIYREVDHAGCEWAYGMHPFWCGKCPVFFKPGDNARWCFIGYAHRVLPFANY